MIFLTVGSQKFQFNRLLEYIDSLIEKEIIQEKVFAQIGYSDYLPKNYEYKNFLDRDEFIQRIQDSRIVITHGGTGSIMGAVKEGKRVIAVPRLSRYGEHVDDHQEQIVDQLIAENVIIGVNQLEDIGKAIERSDTISVRPYVSNTNAIIESIEDYISQTAKGK